MTAKTDVSADYLRSTWRFLASVKLTVVLLPCIAGLSVIGTVIPQNAEPQEYIRLFGGFGYRVMLLLDIVDMYASWWFTGLLMLLVVNIIVCSIERLKVSGKIIFTKHPKFDLDSFRKRKNRCTLNMGDTPAGVEKRYKEIVGRQFRFCRVVPLDSGFAITAERGLWTRLGVYAVHLSIVVLLLGALIGAQFGFQGFVTLVEGDQANTISLEKANHNKVLPFHIRCDEFEVQFYKGGRRPKTFRSSLTILEQGQEVLRKDIRVNDPLRFKGIGIYQSTYGLLEPGMATQAPPMTDAPDTLSVSLRSKASGMVYTREASIGQPLQIPEGLGSLAIERFEPNAKFRGMELGPAMIATLIDPAGNTQSITMPFRFPRFDAMRGGKVVIAIADKVSKPAKERYYTG
ncbi:MAG: cytochrome c biogenesis protein ResB, partial [Desulfatitalea sp.]|nr:cytochrome c biogenesis protein ResB [Desulfatitalea sp.]